MSTAVSQPLSVDLHIRLAPDLAARLSYAAARSGLNRPALARAVLSHQLPMVPVDDQVTTR